MMANYKKVAVESYVSVNISRELIKGCKQRQRTITIVTVQSFIRLVDGCCSSIDGTCSKTCNHSQHCSYRGIAIANGKQQK